MKSFFSADGCWFWHPERKAGEAGYTLFRRRIDCTSPERLRLAVSADNRYNLYLDGELLGRGPCRSDLEHYCFEEYDLELSAGTHLLAMEVVVWQGGWRSSAAAWSEIHAGGGMMVCGSVGNRRLNGPDGWRTQIDAGRRPLEWREAWDAKIMTPIPPMDLVDYRLHPCDWMRPEFDDSDWLTPCVVGELEFSGNIRHDPGAPWHLTPRTVKQLRIEPTPLLTNIPYGTVPAGLHSFTIDIGRNQTSMIRLNAIGGKGRIRLAYAEKPGDGYADLLLPAPGAWEYRSFWIRSGRYIECRFELEEPLEIVGFAADFVTYDFLEWAEFHAPAHPMLEKIWHVSSHTALCCAHEHYEDCPYYEQLQYAGDTRVQALISYSATGDGTLGRQALRHFDRSRQPFGLTQSRYPNCFTQVIPEFSLIWVLMVHDYYRYFGDEEVLSEHRDGIDRVLAYFEARRESSGLIGYVGYWNFSDWGANWPDGKSDRGDDAPETVLNLFYANACRAAEEINRVLGRTECADQWNLSRIRTLNAVNAVCFDEKRGRYRDVPGKEYYSIHANALAILADAVPAERLPAIVSALTEDKMLTQGTLYFNFYVLEALKKCGCAEMFSAMLQPWINCIEAGDTTFPESPAPNSRSRCHAWSASPVYEFITGLLGISPGEAGFRTVAISPLAIPNLKLSARIPLGPDNRLSIRIDKTTIALSADHPVTFRYNGVEQTGSSFQWERGSTTTG